LLAAGRFSRFLMTSSISLRRLRREFPQLVPMRLTSMTPPPRAKTFNPAKRASRGVLLGVVLGMKMGGTEMTSIARKLAQALKPLIPTPVYNSSKTLYSQRRYSSLWRKRSVVQFVYKSIPISLVIVDPSDLIQEIQASGAFYEEIELEDIAPYFRKGGVFVDVGANTGQHSIYFAKVLGASKIIMFEPIQQTCRLLLENIRLNSLDSISDVANLGIGLGDKPNRATFSVGTTNLGAASLHESATGPIETKAGDSVLREPRIDFIKIDTEGFEIKVLSGLANTIQKHRPTIYVEIDERNKSEFEDFLRKANYRIEKRHKNYPANENFLILPN
jgi:FkbM family methyltransferase